MAQDFTKKNSGAIIIFIIAIIALLFLNSSYHFLNVAGLGISIPGVFTTNNSCSVQSSTSNLCEAQNLASGFGSSITSLSQIITAEGGKVFLVNFVVNDQPQVASGTVKTVVQAINQQTSQSLSSNQNSTNLAFTAKLVNESYYFPYQNTGTQIYEWGYKVVPISYSAPETQNLLTGNCQGNGTASTNYTLTCYGSQYGGAYESNITLYANSCHNNQNGYLAFIGSPSATGLWGAIFGNNQIKIHFQCVQPQAVPLTRAVFEPAGTKFLYANVSITYQNSSGTYTGYVTNKQVSSVITNRIYANLVGYLYSASGDITGASQPYYLLMNGSEVGTSGINLGGGYTFYKSVSQTQYTLAQSYAYPNTGASTNFTTGEAGAEPPVSGKAGTQTTVPWTLSLATLQTNLNSQNSRVISEIIPIQNYSIYGTSAYINYGNIDGIIIPLYNSSGPNKVLNGVPWSPQVQVVANVSTLSLYIPLTISAPNITAVSPNPFKITFGTQEQLTVTVKNTGTLANNYYAIVTCGSIQAGSSTDAVSIQPGSTQTISLTINTAALTTNQSIPCTAIAYSSVNANIASAPYSFNEQGTAVCAPNEYGQIVNGQNCQAYTTYVSTSTIPPTPGGGGNGSSGTQIPLIDIIIVVIIIAVILILASRTKIKGGGGYTPSGDYKRPVGRPPKSSYSSPSGM